MCNGELVNLQYILQMIWNDQNISEIFLVRHNKNLDIALATIAHQLLDDVKNGINKEEYSLTNLSMVPVKVDIKKKDIQKVNDYTFTIKNQWTRIK